MAQWAVASALALVLVLHATGGGVSGAIVDYGWTGKPKPPRLYNEHRTVLKNPPRGQRDTGRDESGGGLVEAAARIDATVDVDEDDIDLARQHGFGRQGVGLRAIARAEQHVLRPLRARAPRSSVFNGLGLDESEHDDVDGSDEESRLAGQADSAAGSEVSSAADAPPATAHQLPTGASASQVELLKRENDLLRMKMREILDADTHFADDHLQHRLKRRRSTSAGDGHEMPSTGSGWGAGTGGWSGGPLLRLSFVYAHMAAACLSWHRHATMLAPVYACVYMYTL